MDAVYLSYSSNLLRVGPLQASTVEAFDKILGSFTCYLLSQRSTCYMPSGFF